MLAVAALAAFAAVAVPSPLAQAEPAAPAVITPDSTSRVIARGDSLDAIAAARYGSRHYAALLVVVDHVDPEKLSVGKTLALPSLAAMAAPLAKPVPDGTAALLRAHASWRAIAAALADDHRHHRALSHHDELARAAADAHAARKAFFDAGASTLQLRSLADTLDGLAAGSIDRDGYALDEVDRRFAYALAGLITWTRE